MRFVFRTAEVGVYHAGQARRAGRDARSGRPFPARAICAPLPSPVSKPLSLQETWCDFLPIVSENAAAHALDLCATVASRRCRAERRPVCTISSPLRVLHAYWVAAATKWPRLSGKPVGHSVSSRPTQSLSPRQASCLGCLRPSRIGRYRPLCSAPGVYRVSPDRTYRGARKRRTVARERRAGVAT